MVGHNIKTYKRRFQSFGWNPIVIDGHNIKQIMRALTKAKYSKMPTVILAKTLKGKGVSFLENKDDWHGKPVPSGKLVAALDEIPKCEFPQISIKKPGKHEVKTPVKKKTKLGSYKIGEMVAARQAYGNALANLASANSDIVAVDAEVSNSTYSAEVKKKSKEQFIETYIAEQNMIGIALGLSTKGIHPFASTFSAFLSRAHDQLRMASLSSGNFTVCGSHAGVSIGEDGASQMGLEDIALFRSLAKSNVFYPSDAVSAERLTQQALKQEGISYIRTSRPKTPVLYSKSSKFPVGDFKVLKQGTNDNVVLIGSGVTLHESLAAWKSLKTSKINVSVVDLYCIKPLNVEKLVEFVKKHGGKTVVTEDHFKEGGIGEMLSSAFINNGIKMKHLYVKGIPHSGTKDQLMERHGINSDAIEKAAREF